MGTRNLRFKTKQPYLCPSSLVTSRSCEPPFVLQHDLLRLPAQEGGGSVSALIPWFRSLILHKQQLPNSLKYSHGLSHHQPLIQAILFSLNIEVFAGTLKLLRFFSETTQHSRVLLQGEFSVPLIYFSVHLFQSLSFKLFKPK